MTALWEQAGLRLPTSAHVVPLVPLGTQIISPVLGEAFNIPYQCFGAKEGPEPSWQRTLAFAPEQRITGTSRLPDSGYGDPERQLSFGHPYTQHSQPGPSYLSGQGNGISRDFAGPRANGQQLYASSCHGPASVSKHAAGGSHTPARLANPLDAGYKVGLGIVAFKLIRVLLCSPSHLKNQQCLPSAARARADHRHSLFLAGDTCRRWQQAY